MSSEELVNIATNVDTYLRYLATPGQTRFVAPSRKLGGAPYPLEADLIVHVDSVPTTIPWAYDANTSEIVLSNGLMAGALVEIWRRTEVDESLVEFPVAQKWLPKDNNKSMTQLLMCIQELWGGIKELSKKVSVVRYTSWCLAGYHPMVLPESIQVMISSETLPPGGP